MSEEVRVTNETTGGQKGSKLARYDLVPGKPLLELAELYGMGAKKYADRNWERGYDWNLSFAALQRHAWAFWNGEDLIPQTPDGEPDDPTAGAKHMIAVAWHALALAQFMDERRELDTRPHVSPAELAVACEGESRVPSVLSRKDMLEAFQTGLWKKPVLEDHVALSATGNFPDDLFDAVQLVDLDEERYEMIRARKKQEKKERKAFKKAQKEAERVPTTTYETVKAAQGVGLLTKTDPASLSRHVSTKEDSFLLTSELTEANPDMAYWDNDVKAPVKEED